MNRRGVRRGIGADGLLLLTILGDDELAMVLHNSDGSRAETSGNGIRCLVQAAYAAKGRSGPARYLVHTEAGERIVDVEPIDSATIRASVSMGAVSGLDEPSGWAAVGTDPMRPVLHLSTGNPHTVVGVDDVTTVDLLSLGLQMPFARETTRLKRNTRIKPKKRLATAGY